MFIFGNYIFTVFAAGIIVISSVMVSAQNDTDAEAALDDFIHYSLIANVEFAEAFAMSLLRDDMSDIDFYNMVSATKDRQKRFDRSIGWGRFVTELEPLVMQLESRYEAGRTAVIRDADRLNEAIEFLGGTTRQRLLATDRLIEAGEYAVPYLLRSLQVSNDARNARRVSEMLTDIGRDAILPLVVAIPHLDDESQVLVVKVLGDIRYIHSLPSLNELLANKNESQNVKNSILQSIKKIGFEANANLSTLNTVVAQQFYDGDDSVMPRSVSGNNIYWYWDDAMGLRAKDVPHSIFDDVMAMHYSEKALGHDPKNVSAMSVFVAANFRRNRELAGQEDQVYGNLSYSPEFYATVFGPEIAQHVLAKAIIDSDTALALDAIGALSRTAGSSVLIADNSHGRPLVTAMFYPDRRVQYEAAMTIASTLPTEDFVGDYRVVPLLASAVRNSGQLFAIVIGDDSEIRRDMSAFLERNGWNVAGEGVDVAQAINSAGVVPGIDLAVILPSNADHGKALRHGLGVAAETTVTPILALSEGANLKLLALSMGEDDMVETASISISDSAKLAVLEDLLASASGGRLADEETDLFAFRSLGILRDIAIAETALDITDATGTLIDALDTINSTSQIMVAETLALINSNLAQRALINAALDAVDVEQRIMLLNQAATSVRHWGNNAQKWQVESVVHLTENSSGNLADAAARLNGALNHPHTSVMMLLPE